MSCLFGFCAKFYLVLCLSLILLIILQTSCGDRKRLPPCCFRLPQTACAALQQHTRWKTTLFATFTHPLSARTRNQQQHGAQLSVKQNLKTFTRRQRNDAETPGVCDTLPHPSKNETPRTTRAQQIVVSSTKRSQNQKASMCFVSSQNERHSLACILLRLGFFDCWYAGWLAGLLAGSVGYIEFLPNLSCFYCCCCKCRCEYRYDDLDAVVILSKPRDWARCKVMLHSIGQRPPTARWAR